MDGIFVTSILNDVAVIVQPPLLKYSKISAQGTQVISILTVDVIVTFLAIEPHLSRGTYTCRRLKIY
jgi:hypothetical protein